MNQRAETESATLKDLIAALKHGEEQLRLGGGHAAMERQHAKRRMTARERVARLVDSASQVLELGLWAGYEMYADWGGAPAAGVVTAVGTIGGRRQMIIRNDGKVQDG